MPEIDYKTFKDSLSTSAPSAAASLYLIHGDEYIYKKAFKELLDVLLPEDKRKFSFEQVDGADGSVHDVLDRINTYGFFSSAKIVAFTDAKLFYGKTDDEKLIRDCRAAHAKGDLKKAGKLLMKLLALWNGDLDDLDAADGEFMTRLKSDDDDTGWVPAVAGHCRETGLQLPDETNEAELMRRAVEKGFPRGHVLILTTDSVDKRKTLYKSIRDKGVVVDCSVPQGNRQADKKVQAALMKETLEPLLGKSKKKMDPGVYQALVEITGFDLRTLVANLEKLITYVGDRERIQRQDLSAVLKRTKTDPIYELTGAVADRDKEAALFYLTSLLNAGFYPLQILAALTNQLRKLAVVKDFMEGEHIAGRGRGMSFPEFKANVFPRMQEYDQRTAEYIAQWQPLDKDDNDDGKGRRKQAKIKSDVLLAQNAGNPYPLYLLALKTEKFRAEELQAAFTVLRKTDERLKLSGGNPKFILEDAILHIC